MIYAEPETVPDTADAVLIQRSWREPERFAAIFDRHYTDIHGYAARRLGRCLADDVAAETFLIAFDRRRRYDRAHPSARPWLYGIASNLIARHHRAELRQYRALMRAAGQLVEGDDDQVATYLGERSTVVRDAVIDRLKAGNETGEIREGQKVVTERIATAIVDAAGERP